MSPRSICQWTGLILALFYTGMELTRLSALSFTDVSAIVLCSCLALALAASIVQSAPPDSSTMRSLLGEIRSEVADHLQQGHNTLVPGDGFDLESKISLGQDGDDVIIEEIPPGLRTRRRYTVRADGKLALALVRAGGSLITHYDEQWRDSAITERRLRQLLATLQSHEYERCFESISR